MGTKYLLNSYKTTALVVPVAGRWGGGLVGIPNVIQPGTTNAWLRLLSRL